MQQTRRELSSRTSPAGHIRSIPLLNWHQMGEFAQRGGFPDPIHAEALIEATDMSGTRTFALKVQDDSMQPLFRKGEMIFVNPDVKWNLGDYVVVTRRTNGTASTVFRQLRASGDQRLLHPLNWEYEDLPLIEQDIVWGKVVRLRKISEQKDDRSQGIAKGVNGGGTVGEHKRREVR